MGSQSEAIGKFNEYASILGHPLQNEINGFVDLHGRETHTRHFKALNGTSYLTQIAPSSEYGLVTAHYNILSDIEKQLPESELEELANSDHGYREHDEEGLNRVGARALLLHCEDDNLADAKEEIRRLLNSPDVVYRLDTTENGGAPYHVFVYKRVFPYHDSFTPARFSDVVRTVTHYRQRVSEIFHQEIDLPIEEESFTKESVENESEVVGNHAFQ